jgi:hypothetical protein
MHGGTTARLRALRNEARAAGDLEQYEMAVDALEGDERALARCIEALADAEAQDEGRVECPRCSWVGTVDDLPTDGGFFAPECPVGTCPACGSSLGAEPTR